MIVWLASYPRSGNTMLRMILKSVFGKATYSKYNDIADIGSDPKMMELVGHRMFEDEWATAYHTMTEATELFLVKTHDGPEDNAKAIYIVRDGRAAVVSYQHYIKDFAGKDNPLADIIAGFDDYGSWGSHLDSWAPLQRPNTLLIRYERLLTNPEEECGRIAGFLGLDILGQWRNDFKAFHNVNPRFFRKGDQEKGKAELAGNDLGIFWLFHGDWMETLGYVPTVEVPKYNFKMLREIPCRKHGVWHDALTQKNEYVKSELGKLNSLLKQKDEQLTQKNEYMKTEFAKLNDLLKQKDEQLTQKNEYMKTEFAKLNDLLKQKDEQFKKNDKYWKDQLNLTNVQLKQIDESMKIELSKLNGLLKQKDEQLAVQASLIAQLRAKVKDHEEQFRQKCEELIEVDDKFKVKCVEVVSKDEALVKLIEEKSGELLRFEEEKKVLEEELRRRDERITELLNSMSWKITSPLRAVYGKLLGQKK